MEASSTDGRLGGTASKQIYRAYKEKKHRVNKPFSYSGHDAVNFPRIDPTLQEADSTFGSSYDYNCTFGCEMEL